MEFVFFGEGGTNKAQIWELAGPPGPLFRMRLTLWSVSWLMLLYSLLVVKKVSAALLGYGSDVHRVVGCQPDCFTVLIQQRTAHFRRVSILNTHNSHVRFTKQLLRELSRAGSNTKRTNRVYGLSLCPFPVFL